MKLDYLTDKNSMLQALSCVQNLYPQLTMEEYSSMLVDMLANNYGQIQVKDNNEIIGVCGVWLGTKLWCGKYLEMDNVIIAPNYRSKGLGKLITEYAENLAKEKNCNIMALDAYTNNFKAHKFYYNHGFEPKGFHFIKDL